MFCKRKEIYHTVYSTLYYTQLRSGLIPKGSMAPTPDHSITDGLGGLPNSAPNCLLFRAH